MKRRGKAKTMGWELRGGRLGQAQRAFAVHGVSEIAGSRYATLRLTQLTALAAILLSAGAVHAQNGPAFYNGKTVTYIVATAPGGGYDAYGRLVAEYMQKYLPGSTFVVKNVPGAGHLIGANTIYASRADGLTIGTFNTGLVYNQIIGQSAVRFDLARMTWIGKAGSDPRAIAIAAQTPAKSFTELKASATPLNFATSGIASANYVEITLLTNLLRLPVKLLTGYNGNEDQLAMRRGEVQGGLGARSSFDGFVKNGYGRFIAQIGGTEKDVPQLATLVDEPKAKPLLELIGAQSDIARLTAGPPGIPADRTQTLRTAFGNAMADKELKEKAERLGRPLEPLVGDAVLDRLKRALDQPPELVAALKAAMTPIDKGAKQ